MSVQISIYKKSAFISKVKIEKKNYVSIKLRFDKQLKMVTQMNKTCKAAFFRIFNIRRIRKFLSSDTVQTLVNTFVTSRLDYCNSILFGLPNTELQKLQRQQYTAARLICNTNNFDHIIPTLVKLHWLLVKYRVHFKNLLITFKTIHGLALKYLSELLTRKKICNYNLRSTSEILLQPRTKTLRTLGDRSSCTGTLEQPSECS